MHMQASPSSSVSLWFFLQSLIIFTVEIFPLYPLQVGLFLGVFFFLTYLNVTPPPQLFFLSNFVISTVKFCVLLLLWTCLSDVMLSGDSCVSYIQDRIVFKWCFSHYLPPPFFFPSTGKSWEWRCLSFWI